MEIQEIIDNIETWYDADDTHTSVLFFSTVKEDKDNYPTINAFKSGDAKDALLALTSLILENPDLEETVSLALRVVKRIRKAEEASNAIDTTGKEDSHAS